jgi:Xaa-Pro aminopeptidase
MPAAKLHTHELCYAGESFPSKVNRLRDLMKNHGAGAHVVTLLDGVAWLFNLRGGDTPYSPLAIAYALITLDRAFLFIDPRKVDDTVRSHLGDGVTVQPYEDFPKGLKALRTEGTRTWIDPTTCSQWVVGQLQPSTPLFFKESPIHLFKALKNKTEIQGFRVAHLRDGLAWVRFIKWLEDTVPKGGVTERTASTKLQEFRCAYPHYRGPSFESIVAFKEHGAVVHYMPTPETDFPVEIPGLLLVDSGAQYLEGTTDVTRVIALGEPTEEQEDRFTRVLKGHIRLVTQLFPSGTKGVQLDVLARKDLWACGLDFGHGTGHGVGSYLSAHEGSVSISTRTNKGIPLAPGMVCSVEPGYYKEGEYGIRLENLVVVQEASEISRDLSPFLKFEVLTLCPFDLKLVKRELLFEKERAWLNQYHETLRKSLTPLLEEEESQWLIKATRKI